MKELTISSSEKDQRLDKFVKRYMKKASFGFICRMIRQKNITVNGKRAEPSTRLAEGDIVKLFLSDRTISKFQKDDSQSYAASDYVPDIIYEDSDIAVINKPAGMLSQMSGNGELSLSEYIKSYYKKGPNGFSPSPANRLDRNTCGIILCGLTLEGLNFLNNAVKERRFTKIYTVLVSGKCDLDGIYRGYIRKKESGNTVVFYDSEEEGSREAVTGFKVIETSGGFSLLKAELITGRPHQIRAHLAHLGYPVAGDNKYGDRRLNEELKSRFGLSYQFLFSGEITFDSVEERFSYLAGRTFKADMPADFIKILKELGFKYNE